MIVGVYCSKPSEDGGVKQDTTALECPGPTSGVSPRDLGPGPVLGRWDPYNLYSTTRGTRVFRQYITVQNIKIVHYSTKYYV